MYLLCFFSYLPINDLYLIKLLSVLFDVLLAYGVMMIVDRFTESQNIKLASFFTVLLLPTVFLNGALWAQCDSIYAALAILGLWLALEKKPVLSVLCFTLSVGFKLQAVFILPIVAVLLLTKKYKLWHMALFPAFYIALVIPAVIMGKPFIETLTLYLSQTGSIGSGLNYNSPSVYALLRTVQNEAGAAIEYAVTEDPVEGYDEPIVTGKASILPVKVSGTSLLGWNGDGSPRLSKSEFSTEIQVGYTGKDFVIGGIKRTNVIRSVAGVPFLKDLPVLGWVFSTETETTRHSELVLIARAEISGPFDAVPDSVRKDLGDVVDKVEAGRENFPPLINDANILLLR